MNFNEIIYQEIIKLSRLKEESNRVKVVNHFINDYLYKICRYELSTDNYAWHNNVIWKWNDDHSDNVSEVNFKLIK